MKLSEYNIASIHMGLTSKCTLGCLGCPHTIFSQAELLAELHDSHINHKFYSALIEKMTDQKIDYILLCGNYGDPIYYPGLLELCATMKKYNIKLHIHTNGSYKSKEFWIKLASILHSNDKITFSVDGDSNNFTTYRVNGKWTDIKMAMQTVKSVLNPPMTNWKYLVFDYNKNTVLQALYEAKKCKIDTISYCMGIVDETDDTQIFLKTTYNKTAIIKQIRKAVKKQQIIIGGSRKCPVIVQLR